MTKILKILTVFMVILSCKQPQKKTLILEPSKPFSEPKIVESNIEPNKSELKYPKWLRKLYPSEIKIGPQVINQKLIDYVSINDSFFYCRYSQSDDVCFWEYLITFRKQQKVDSLNISDMCDHEQSIPTYSWKESAFIGKTKIVNMEYTESVVDSLINEDGRIIRNLDFSSVETITDSIFTEYKISDFGVIELIKK